MRDRAHGTQVGERDERRRAPLHHRPGCLGERREAVAADVVRDAESVPTQRVEELARERLARREGDRMHQAVESIPALRELREHRVDLGIFRHVAREHQIRAEFLRQLHHPVSHALALIGECQVGTFPARGLRHAVCDRAAADESGNENFPAGEKSHGGSVGMKTFSIA